MSRLLSLIVVLFLSTAFAKMPVSSQGVMSMFVKDKIGMIQFACSGAKVTHPKLSRYDTKKTNTTYLLSAAHCAEPDVAGGKVPNVFASFNGGKTLFEVVNVLQGVKEDGTDYALWIPKTETKEYLAVPAYKLSDRLSLDADEEVYNWSYPGGISLVALRGRVTSPVLPVPLTGKPHPWIGEIGLDLNITGGSSGSSLFDEKGEVVGIIVGTLSNERAWKIVTAVPIWFLLNRP